MLRMLMWSAFGLVLAMPGLAAWAADGGSGTEQAQPVVQQATATIPVIRDGRVVQLDPTELEAVTIYMIAIRCLDGNTLLTESWVNIRQGNEAVIKSSRSNALPGTTGVIESSSSHAGAVRYSSYFVVDAGGEWLTAKPAVVTGSKEQPQQPEVKPAKLAVLRDASCVFSFGGVNLAAYCPGATTIECEIYRQYTPAPRLMKRPGELLAEYVPSGEQPVELVGSFTAALSCPDLGYVGPDGTVYGDQPPEK